MCLCGGVGGIEGLAGTAVIRSTEICREEEVWHHFFEHVAFERCFHYQLVVHYFV